MVSRPRAIGRRYALQREIGHGGMGAVWLAVDEVLGREVAVKRVGLFPGGSSPDLMRAQREAKLAASLNHPHVVSVFDFLTEGEEQWLVMEYVAGTNLAALAKNKGGLPPAEAADLVGQAAEALAAAHAAGIVHRDVKPSNILVTDERRAKLADFGIARARADSTMTASGTVTGTPAYLAPEVASGTMATDASDVWSLGATLFHTLTGRPPYDLGDNVLAAMYRIVHDDPPRLAESGWPAGLLENTMAADPADRWPMSRVREYLRDGPPSGPGASAEDPAVTLRLPGDSGDPTVSIPAAAPATEDPSRRAAGRLALVALALLLLVAAAGWALLRDGAAQRPAVASTPAATPTQSASPRKSPRSTPSATSSGAGATSSSRDGGAARMSSFVENYIATALSDPAAAWRELTPRFQAKVGSYGNYAGYWNTIESAPLHDVRADPANMTVSYVITWDPKGPRGKEDANVVLDLVEQDGHYLIDRER